MKTAAPNAPRPKHVLAGKRAAQARYSAVDFFASPGLLPSRSVGVSPMPTIAVCPRMLMMGFLSLSFERYFSADNLSSKVEKFMLDSIKLTAHGRCEIRRTVKLLPVDSALAGT